MLFNDHQSRLWSNMLKTIHDFRAGKLPYFDLVYSLEGDLDAGEFKNRELIEQWYNFWTPLEILFATKGHNVTAEDASKYISDMERFLKSFPIDGSM